ncbi:condensation domain-containing protein [Xylariaceae sp. FL0804]|nr:condensation domain-containing protein [Xylariaceae sp. FL0804]
MIKDNVYEIEAGKTMRMQLLSKCSTEHFLVLRYHHINMDGISFEVLFPDLEMAYNGELFNTSVMQYPDFALREVRQYKFGQRTPELDYWRGQFRTLPEPLPLLPLSKRTSRPRRVTYPTHTVKRRVSAEQSAAIKDVGVGQCQGHGIGEAGTRPTSEPYIYLLLSPFIPKL